MEKRSSLAGPELLCLYLGRLAALQRHGDAREESYYSSLRLLLEGAAAASGRRQVHVTEMPRRTEEGVAADLQVWRGGRLVGYVEAKRPGASLHSAKWSRQLARYLDTFPNLLVTNFQDFWLFQKGERAEARLAGAGLAECYAGRLESYDDGGPVLALLGRFLDFETPRVLGAAALAAELAKRARVLEEVVEDLLAREDEAVSELHLLYRTFADHLIRGLTAREFADLYAQTVAYGLLAARWNGPEEFDRAAVLASVPRASGILRDVLRCLLPEDGAEARPRIAWIVDDIVDLLAASPVREILARHHVERRRQDPIHHFYETFLFQYDRRLRRSRGVYYTPPEVVSFIVRSVHELLQTRLGRREGLADPEVTFLDPAAGTLTFLVEAFRCAITTYRERYGPGGVPALIRDHLLRHGFAFELMMAPYAIGHLKMSLYLREEDYALAPGERVRLYLTNALELDDQRQPPIPGLAALDSESREANRIKREQRVTVVFGNPPYSGHSYNRGQWVRDLLRRYPDDPPPPPGCADEGYYQVDGAPLEERNPKWLQDDYVKFLRFAQWKVEAAGEGIVAMITNHGWLDGVTFRGLRRSLLRTFDEVYLLDLHGNRKKRERAADGGADENVFEDVEQGVAIALLVKGRGLGKDGKKVFRGDLRGRRLDKLARLGRWQTVGKAELREVAPGPPGYLFAAGDARREEEYRRGVPLPAIFPERSAGVLTARDALVVGFEEGELRLRIDQFRVASDLPAFLRAHGVRGGRGFDFARAQRRARVDEEWRERFVPVLFRPFDRRWLFYADYLVERPRAEVMRHLLGGGNLALVAPRQSRDEPGALVADRLVAHKAVAAYDVNSVFPLYLRAPERRLEGQGREANLSAALLDALAELHGRRPSPEEMLDYVYAVLYSRDYRERYRDQLARDFPRIPFPRERRTFAALAALGGELVAAHLLASGGAGGCARYLVRGSDRVAADAVRRYRPDEGKAVINDEGQCFEGIVPEVWTYRIGGYQALPRWLASRAGRRLCDLEIRDLCAAAGALGRTLEIERRIAGLYPEVREDCADLGCLAR